MHCPHILYNYNMYITISKLLRRRGTETPNILNGNLFPEQTSKRQMPQLVVLINYSLAH